MAIITNPVSIHNIARELGIADSQQCNLIDMVEDTSRINLMSKYQPGSNQGTNYGNLVNFKTFNRTMYLPGTSKYEDPRYMDQRLEATRNPVSKPYKLRDWLNYNSDASILEVTLSDTVLRPGNWMVRTTVNQIDRERAASIIGAPVSRCKYGYMYLFNTSPDQPRGGYAILDGGWPLSAIYNGMQLDIGGINWYMNNQADSDSITTVYVMPVVWDSAVHQGDSIKLMNDRTKIVTIIPNKHNQVIYKRYDIGQSSQEFKVLVRTESRINSLNPWDVSIGFQLRKEGDPMVSYYNGTLMGLSSGTVTNTRVLYKGELNIPQGGSRIYHMSFSMSIPELTWPSISNSVTRGLSVSGSFPSQFTVTATQGGVLTIVCS